MGLVGFPDGVAYQIREQFFLLVFHYEVSPIEVGLIDYSGVNLYITTQSPAKEMGVVMLVI